MAFPTRSAQGFTLVEFIVLLAVIAILAILAVPYVTGLLIRHDVFNGLTNARQIHTATMAMAIDGVTNKDRSLGWPGDLKAHGDIETIGDFANVLVVNGYCSRADDLKVFAGPGCKTYKGTLSPSSNGMKLVPAFKDENSVFKVYLVKDDDQSNTLFLVTRNYTYNTPLTDPSAKPFGDRGCMLIRKGGDARSVKKQQAQDLAVIGTLPGGGTVESAENCLNPSAVALPQK